MASQGATLVNMLQPPKDPRGFCELEMSYTGEEGLRDRKRKCRKNPNHTDFIAIPDFNITHLPLTFRDENVVKLIKAQVDLTVRVVVNKADPNRPQWFWERNELFPPYDRSNLESGSPAGSGWVRNVTIYDSEDKKPCKCYDCSFSSQPMTNWAEIMIMTANHVVHNTKEAKNTTFYFHYDTPDTDLDQVPKLTGLEVTNYDINGDWSEIRCVTHDTRFAWSLQATYMNYLRFYRERYVVSKKTEEPGSKFDQTLNWVKFSFELESTLTVITSHPHGCEKQISVGECVAQRRKGWFTDMVEYTYSAPTCPGSSGAPVSVLSSRSEMVAWCEHVHRGGSDECGINTSGLGLSDSARLLILTKVNQTMITCLGVMLCGWLMTSLKPVLPVWLYWPMVAALLGLLFWLLSVVYLRIVVTWFISELRSHLKEILVFTAVLMVVTVSLTALYSYYLGALDATFVLGVAGFCGNGIPFTARDSTTKTRSRWLWLRVCVVPVVAGIFIIAFQAKDAMWLITALVILVSTTAAIATAALSRPQAQGSAVAPWWRDVLLV